MIPEGIKSNLLEYCRKQGGVAVSICRKDNPAKKTGLSFDINGKAKLLSGDIHLIQYVENHMKYARNDIIIKINDIELKELPIVPLQLGYENDEGSTDN